MLGLRRLKGGHLTLAIAAVSKDLLELRVECQVVEECQCLVRRRDIWWRVGRNSDARTISFSFRQQHCEDNPWEAQNARWGYHPSHKIHYRSYARRMGSFSWPSCRSIKRGKVSFASFDFFHKDNWTIYRVMCSLAKEIIDLAVIILA